VQVTIDNPSASDTITVFCSSPNASGACPLELVYVLSEYNLLQNDTVNEITKICPYQEVVELVAQNGFSSYYWPLSGEDTVEIEHTIVADEFRVELQMKDYNFCDYVQYFNLEYYPSPYDTTIDIGQYCLNSDQVDFYAPVIYSGYQWYINGVFQDSGSVIYNLKSPNPKDEIQISFIDSFNCLRIYKTELEPNLLPGNLVENPIPNAFSPIPADGFNDMLLFPFYNYEFFELEILNRWGQVVYLQKSSIDKIFWDGRNLEGKIIPGVYFYKLSLSACGSAELAFHQGFVHLFGETD
jgi:hypothetical protein